MVSSSGDNVMNNEGGSRVVEDLGVELTVRILAHSALSDACNSVAATESDVAVDVDDSSVAITVLVVILVRIRNVEARFDRTNRHAVDNREGVDVARAPACLRHEGHVRVGVFA